MLEFKMLVSFGAARVFPKGWSLQPCRVALAEAPVTPVSQKRGGRCREGKRRPGQRQLLRHAGAARWTVRGWGGVGPSTLPGLYEVGVVNFRFFMSADGCERGP